MGPLFMGLEGSMSASHEPPCPDPFACLYDNPCDVTTNWGHHRIFAQQAYRRVRETQFVPILLSEAHDLARWFPICWVLTGDGPPVLSAFRSLLDGGRGMQRAISASQEALPWALQAYPFVVPDAASVRDQRMRFDTALADKPTDVGAPILTEDGRFSRAARGRARTAVHVSHHYPQTLALSQTLRDLGLLVNWPLALDLGNGQQATFQNLMILDKDRLDDPVLHTQMMRFGIEAALLVAAHRLSLFRMNTLLTLAREDARVGSEGSAASHAEIVLP